MSGLSSISSFAVFVYFVLGFFVFARLTHGSGDVTNAGQTTNERQGKIGLHSF